MIGLNILNKHLKYGRTHLKEILKLLKCHSWYISNYFNFRSKVQDELACCGWHQLSCSGG